MDYDLKHIKILGYTTDFQKCDCCGKENLAGTVAILDLDNDVILHFGTTCAAKADKYDTYDTFRAAKVEMSKAMTLDRNRKQSAATQAYNTLTKEFGVISVENGTKPNCSECCYQDVYCQILKARRGGNGGVFNPTIPAQWTGINSHKGYK